MPEITKFVIHDHHAKRAGHHWDFRIARDEVLKSWAIPKAHLPAKGERLLAIRTPDHPMAWYTFKGNITDTYGRGKVDIHDKGKCIILKWTPDKIGFTLKGSKEKGTFWLIRMAGKKQTKNWILLRAK